MADTGFVAAGAGASDASGSFTWSNPGNITADDATRATCSSDGEASAWSDYLYADTFDFSAIGASDTIDGIEIRLQNSNNSGDPASNHGTRLFDAAGSPTGTEKTQGSYSPTTDQVLQLGGATDLWGATLTATDVKDVDFGYGMRFEDASADGLSWDCDFMEMKVYYTPGAGAANPKGPFGMPFTRPFKGPFA